MMGSMRREERRQLKWAAEMQHKFRENHTKTSLARHVRGRPISMAGAGLCFLLRMHQIRWRILACPLGLSLKRKISSDNLHQRGNRPGQQAGSGNKKAASCSVDAARELTEDLKRWCNIWCRFSHSKTPSLKLRYVAEISRNRKFSAPRYGGHKGWCRCLRILTLDSQCKANGPRRAGKRAFPRQN